MIVTLSVFCLSAIMYIPIPLTTADKAAQTDSSQTVEAEANTDPTDDIEIEPFAYDTGTAIALWEEASMAAEIDVGTTEIQEDIETAATTDTIRSTDTPENKAGTPDTAETSLTETASADAVVAAKASPEVKEKEEPKKALYSNIGISVAEDFVNIRKDASTDSDILGKLYRNSAAEIIKTDGEWYLVESGSVKGYVKSDFIKTGIPDDELVEKYGELSIIVTVDGLNVREKKDTESSKLDVIYKNEVYPVLDTNNEWIKINITDDKIVGYIKKEFADIIVDFKDAVSKEEEEELQRLVAEEKARKETEVKQQESVSYSTEELKLLACLVHAEAGSQSYEGKLAVANIVLNRMKSSKYPDTMKAVIYQPGQFSVAHSGSLSKQLANYDNYNSSSQRLSIKAAKAALEGANNIGSRLYFHSYRSAVQKGYDEKESSVKLGDQLFW